MLTEKNGTDLSMALCLWGHEPNKCVRVSCSYRSKPTITVPRTPSTCFFFYSTSFLLHDLPSFLSLSPLCLIFLFISRRSISCCYRSTITTNTIHFFFYFPSTSTCQLFVSLVKDESWSSKNLHDPKYPELIIRFHLIILLSCGFA